MRKLEAVILAGGKGTRLQPYTSDIPKPLVPIGDKPVIEILLRQLKKSGVTRAHIAVNHLAHLIMAVLNDGSRLGLDITYSVEHRPLSTVAPIKLIKDLPEHFIVANGDILSDIDVGRLYEHHRAHGAMLTIATSLRTEKIDFGVLEVDDSARVIGFREKPEYRFAVSMGIYVFSRDLLQFVPDHQPFGFDELVLELLRRDQVILQYPYEGYWLDIGRADDYQKACLDIERFRQWLTA